MSRFRPTRASPPPIVSANVTVTSAPSSSVSSLAFSSLTPEDVNLIDAIISRAPSSATTFLAVFKAYNEVLQERGIDPGDDVVYYRLLLKLGVVRGADWGERWMTVKSQMNIRGSVSLKTRPVDSENTGRAVQHHEDSFTVHSHEQSNHHYAAQPTPPTRSFVRILDGLESASVASSSRASLDQEVSGPPDRVQAQFIAPKPSHRLSLQDGQAILRRTFAKPNPVLTKGKGGDNATRAIDAEDTWRKLELEPKADDFRWFSVVRRCWDVWRQGLEWIIATNQQITLARNDLIIRKALALWRSTFVRHMDIKRRAAYVNDIRCLSSAMSIWRRRLKEQRRNKWASSLRLKMSIVKEKVDSRILRDAWERWLQAHRSSLASQHHSHAVLANAFRCWVTRYDRLQTLEARAEQLILTKERRAIEIALDTWKRRVELNVLEAMVSDHRGWRLIGEAMEVWKRNTRMRLVAGDFDDRRVVKAAFALWQKKKARIQTLTRRADNYIYRQNSLLVRAVMRVWIARERGELLQRIRRTRLAKYTLLVWKQRMRRLRAQEDVADAFLHRTSKVQLARCQSVWRKNLKTHRNALNFSVEFHSGKLLSQALYIWRTRMARKAKMAKQAKLVRRLLLKRATFHQMKERLAMRKREKMIAEFDRRKVQEAFYRWLEVSRRERYYRLASALVRKRCVQRILHESLTLWTLRVVDVKVREIAIVEERDERVLRKAFAKWRTVCLRHQDDLSLMRSFHAVKREDLLRRVFAKWLSVARISRHRRARLAERENEVRLATLSAVWEKWRVRYGEERLRPVERMVLMQCRVNLLFRSFRIWEARTQSLLAIRVFAMNAKLKAWGVWRNAMPRALQAREAKEFERNMVLAKSFKKWYETYRTKIALKAVARARYLRLPPAIPPIRPGPVQRMLVKPPGLLNRSIPPERIPSPDRASQRIFPSSSVVDEEANRGRSPNIMKGISRSQGASPARISSPIHHPVRRRFVTTDRPSKAGGEVGDLAAIIPSVSSSTRPPSYPPPPSSLSSRKASEKDTLDGLLVGGKSLTSGLIYAGYKERERLKRLGEG